MPRVPVAEAQPKEDDAVTAPLHPFEQIRQHQHGQTGRAVRGDRPTLQHRPETRQGLEVFAGLDLQEQVDIGTGRARLGVHHDDEAVGSIGNEPAGRPDRITLEVPRMRRFGVGSPEDDQIGPATHLAERAGRFAGVLQGENRRGVLQRRGRVDDGAEAIGQGERGPLSVGGASGQAEDQRLA